MCLSTAYKIENGEKNFVMDKIASMKVEGNEVVFQDLLGRTVKVEGIVKYVDLLSNEIVCAAN